MTLTTLCLGLVLATSNVIASPPESNDVANAGQRVRQMAQATDKERQARYLESTARAIDKAAAELGKEPIDKEAAKKELKGALILLIEAARECASLKAEAASLAGALKAQGGLSEAGVRRLGMLLDLLDKAKAVSSSTSGAGLEQGMGIREIIRALYEVLNTGGHDFWRTQKAISWYLSALLRATWALSAEDRAEIRQLLSSLLDYLMEQGDLTTDQKAHVMEMIDELNEKIADGLSGKDAVAAVNEIKEEIKDAIRQASEERKRRDREEADELEESEREQAVASLAEPLMLASPPPSTTVVQFTSLAGKTEINRRAVGTLQGVYFVAADGEPAEATEVEVDFTEHGEAFSLEFPKTSAILGVVLLGTAGVVEIMQDVRPSPPVTGIGPRDGSIDIRNTVVRETLTTAGPNGEGLTPGPIEDYGITIDGQPTQTIAAQPGQIGIESQGITGNASGQSVIVLTDQGETVVSGVADSWGYNVSTAEVTQRDVWVPITLQVFGVEPQEMIRVTLTPTEGQLIEPTSMVVTGAEAMDPVPIAQLKTEKLGPQQFYVDVRREGQ